MEATNLEFGTENTTQHSNVVGKRVIIILALSGVVWKAVIPAPSRHRVGKAEFTDTRALGHEDGSVVIEKAIAEETVPAEVLPSRILPIRVRLTKAFSKEMSCQSSVSEVGQKKKKRKGRKERQNMNLTRWMIPREWRNTSPCGMLVIAKFHISV